MRKADFGGQHIELAPTGSSAAASSADSASSSAAHKPDFKELNAPSAPVEFRRAVRCEAHHLGKFIYLEEPVEQLEPYAEHGPLVDEGSDRGVKFAGEDLTWVKIRTYFREPLAEFFGVMILILFGDGVVAQVTLSNGENGNYQSISWGWGLGVMLGVYTSGISGAHLNPAVTLANCVFRKFPWRKFPGYLIAQFLGGMIGSAIVYANYKSAIDVFEGGANIRTVPGYSDHATAGIFCTYPQPFMTRTGQFFSEFIASTLLMFLIYVLKDDGNLGAGMLTPLGLFFIIFGIGACFGWETGYAINLARDFGPRLMSWFLGYGTEVFKAGDYYFWIPIVSPFFGCLFGGFLYDTFLFAGDSPMNTPWMGLRRVIRPRRVLWSSRAAERAERDREAGSGNVILPV